MTTQTMTAVEYQRRKVNNRLGLWLFIISDSFCSQDCWWPGSTWQGTRPDVNRLSAWRSPQCF
jgi:hypothetical protein